MDSPDYQACKDRLFELVSEEEWLRGLSVGLIGEAADGVVGLILMVEPEGAEAARALVEAANLDVRVEVRAMGSIDPRAPGTHD